VPVGSQSSPRHRSCGVPVLSEARDPDPHANAIDHGAEVAFRDRLGRHPAEGTALSGPFARKAADDPAIHRAFDVGGAELLDENRRSPDVRPNRRFLGNLDKV
jgi:hypothetical protein